MKLASLKSNTSRDGVLCVVNRSLSKATRVQSVAPTLQYALDNWETVAPKLELIYQLINDHKLSDTFEFDQNQCMAPLPRAYQWADGSAYVNHVELVRKARGADMPPQFWTDPLMYQGGSDDFLGPTDPIVVEDEDFGIDFEAEVAIITDDVPMGINPEDAQKHIKLLMLVNDVSLRELIPLELAKGFGFFQSKPSSSFSPVAVTPDELGTAWDGQRVHLDLVSHVRGELFGHPNAGVDMTFSFPELIQHAAFSRRLSAGTIIGSGTVSNNDRSKGSSCIGERRMIELMDTKEIKTPYLKFGDKVTIEMFDHKGQSIFGAINQTVTPFTGQIR